MRRWTRVALNGCSRRWLRQEAQVSIDGSGRNHDGDANFLVCSVYGMNKQSAPFYSVHLSSFQVHGMIRERRVTR